MLSEKGSDVEMHPLDDRAGVVLGPYESLLAVLIVAG
jgi:hypothetical protein